MSDNRQDGGWVKLHRKLLENPIVMKDANHIAVWVFILLHATHAGKETMFKGERIKLMPGQFVTGREKMAEKLHISSSTIQRILKCFENEQQIEQLMSTDCRLITVKKWSEYQKSEQQTEPLVNSYRTASEQQVNTIQECKKERMKEIPPVVPQVINAQSLGIKRWSEEEIQKQIKTGRKPFLGKDRAYYKGDGCWDVKIYDGTWVPFNDSIIENLSWK